MRLTITIEIDALTGDPADEIGRILRYWGGAAKQLDWSQPLEQALFDSKYKEVGILRMTAD